MTRAFNEINIKVKVQQQGLVYQYQALRKLFLIEGATFFKIGHV